MKEVVQKFIVFRVLGLTSWETLVHTVYCSLNSEQGFGREQQGGRSLVQRAAGWVESSAESSRVGGV